MMTNTNRLASLKLYLTHGAIFRVAVLSLIVVILSISIASQAEALTKQQVRMKYHLMLISNNYPEYQCLDQLIQKESSWIYPSKSNGSHHGLAQMRSEWYRSLSWRQQLNYFKKYVNHRYGDGCKALEHHKIHNWF